MLDKLLISDDIREKRDLLQQQVVDLDAKLTTLTELRNQIKPNSITLKPAWLPSRGSDAQALPGMAGILAGNPYSNANFGRGIQTIFNKSQQMECRHYVQLKNSIPDAIESDRTRLMIENYFYKTELRR